MIGLVLGPPGAVIGAVAGVGLDEAARRGLQVLGERVAARPIHVIKHAAHRAGIPVEELSARLLAAPGGEDLFLKTIRAATDVALEDKLIALSQSLASVADNPSRVDFESQLVGVIADLEEGHFVVLSTFLSSAHDLGLGHGMRPEFTEPVRTLNLKQLERVLPRDVFDLAEPLLAGLERHGLLHTLTFTGTLGGGARRPDQWQITTFGEAVVKRMHDLGLFLGPLDM